MKTLFITARFPYPPHTGGQMRSFAMLKHLTAKGPVTLVAPRNKSVKEEDLPALKEFCEKILLADPKQYKNGGRLRKLFRGEPWLLEDFVHTEILRQILAAHPEEYERILIRYPVMAYFFLTDERLRKLLDRVVIDVDDVSTLLAERELRHLSWGYRKLRYALDLFFLRSYFKKLADARTCLAVSEKDKDYLIREGFSKRVFVVPNTIEVNGRKLQPPIRPAPDELMFCGMLSYPPNQDAAVYFAEKIFPFIRQQIPEAKFTVIGKHASERITKLGLLPGVEVAGYVPSMEPYYEKAAVVVCPLLNGAGTRIKILDAMAHGKPVVSTTIGAEGLEVTNEENILIADDPNAFAQKCIELLKNPAKREALATNAHALVKEKYDVSVFERKMDEALAHPFMPGGINQESSRFGSGKTPLVSVILPTYNRVTYLKKAIESVRAQTFSNWELLVVDDGSNDETSSVVGEIARKDRRIQLLSQVNAGAAAARNHGLSSSRGKYVAFLDDDDEWTPEKLQIQTDYMEAHPEIGMCYTRFKVMRVDGPKAGQFKIFPEELATTFEEMVDSFFIPLPTVMIRRACLAGMPWFNPQFEISEDQDLWFRFVQRWKIAALDQVLTFTVMDERHHLGEDRIAVHEHMIEVMEHLELTPEVERFRSLMEKKKAKLRYAIARDSMDLGHYDEAWRSFAKALASDPLVGLGVGRPGEEGLQLILRVIKSYAAVPACFVKGWRQR